MCPYCFKHLQDGECTYCLDPGESVGLEKGLFRNTALNAHAENSTLFASCSIKGGLYCILTSDDIQTPYIKPGVLSNPPHV